MHDMPLSGPVLVEGGHYTLSLGDDGEPVEIPGFGPARARTTDSTRDTLARAVRHAQRLRRGGIRATVGLMVGDLAIPPGSRVAGGAWALPASYREVLGELAGGIQVWGEAYARNQGKRRLLDEADVDASKTYAAQGWALLRDGEHLLLASDASLDWGGDARAAVLARGHAPLCPLVFAGLKRAIFQAGFRAHVAYYAPADDAWIDVKLRSACATVAQLYRGVAGVQVDALVYGSDLDAGARIWSPDELRAPGELCWSDFLAEVRRCHPGVHPLEAPCPTNSSPPTSACATETTTSRCSG